MQCSWSMQTVACCQLASTIEQLLLSSKLSVIPWRLLHRMMHLQGGLVSAHAPCSPVRLGLSATGTPSRSCCTSTHQPAG
jgi:hypothetical protein